jgi:hypothetical protein
MRDFTHYVITDHAHAGFNQVAPFSGNRDLQPYPQRMVQWSCAGPCLIAWGRNVVPQKPLPDELFLPVEPATASNHPIGRWFKARR